MNSHFDHEHIKMKTALIFGATGLTGNHCLLELLSDDNYEKVISVGRSKLTSTSSSELSNPKLEQHIIDFDNLENCSALFHVDDVFCCLGTTIKKAKSEENFKAIDLELIIRLGKMAKNAGVNTFLVISSHGANPKSASLYPKTKGLMEEALTSLGLNRLIIIRPSLLIGNRDEFRLLEHISAMIYKWLGFLFCGPLKTVKPIECMLVAKALVSSATNDTEESTEKRTDAVRIIANDEIRGIVLRDNSGKAKN